MRVEAGTGVLALEHGRMMARHEDLGVLGHAARLVDGLYDADEA